jgi:hypothetical protein
MNEKSNPQAGSDNYAVSGIICRAHDCRPLKRKSNHGAKLYSPHPHQFSPGISTSLVSSAILTHSLVRIGNNSLSVHILAANIRLLSVRKASRTDEKTV